MAKKEIGEEIQILRKNYAFIKYLQSKKAPSPPSLNKLNNI
jgi:hypothetical protein